MGCMSVKDENFPRAQGVSRGENFPREFQGENPPRHGLRQALGHLQHPERPGRRTGSGERGAGPGGGWKKKAAA